jgi:hypothetical protein
VQQQQEDLTDVANQPHYTCFTIQPIEFIKANELGFLEGNVITKTEDLTDVANQPHYTCFKIQPIEFIKANELGFLEGNVIKYICRYPYKGTPLKDLYKAKDYIEHLIQKEKEKCHE